MKYAVIYNRTNSGWCAHAPDLPGYGAAGDTLDEVRALVREGIPFHLDGMRLDGLPIPEPTTIVEQIDAA